MHRISLHPTRFFRFWLGIPLQRYMLDVECEFLRFGDSEIQFKLTICMAYPIAYSYVATTPQRHSCVKREIVFYCVHAMCVVQSRNHFDKQLHSSSNVWLKTINSALSSNIFNSFQFNSTERINGIVKSSPEKIISS